MNQDEAKTETINPNDKVRKVDDSDTLLPDTEMQDNTQIHPKLETKEEIEKSKVVTKEENDKILEAITI